MPNTYDVVPVGDVSETELTTKIDQLIESNGIIMFSKSTCQFCFEMKRTLCSYGVKFAVFEINENTNCKAIQDYLQTKSGIRTVPNTFVKGKSIGGCIKAKEMEMSGELQSLLNPFVGQVPYEAPQLSAIGLLWFPDTTNGVAVRFGGAFSSIYALLCCIFMFRHNTRWACLYLAIDYILRFVYGAAGSPIGTLAMACASFFPATFKPGPPKQFATACGVFFSLFGALLALGGQPIGAIVILAGLVGAAGMEGFLDFCVGCWFFAMALKLGLVPPSVYRPHLNLVEYRKWAYNFTHSDTRYDEATSQHVLEAGQTVETPVDLVRKDRLETEYKQQDTHYIKHARVDLFAISLTCAALALCFQFTSWHTATKIFNEPDMDFGTGAVAQALGVISVCLAGIFLLLTLARCFMYPKKVCKEWSHPAFGNMWAGLSITFILWGMLWMDSNEGGGIVLVWIGAVAQGLISVFKVGDLVYNRLSHENLTPAIMMGPVGNFVAAIAFAYYKIVYNDIYDGALDYSQISLLWFSVAALFSVVFFVSTFTKSMSDHHSDARTRFLQWIWLATFSIAGPAYFFATGAQLEDWVFQSLWCVSVFLLAVLGLGWFNGFFSYVPDMAIWIMPFSLAAFTLSTILRYFNNDTQFYRICTFVAFAATCGASIGCFVHTLHLLLDGALFRPRPKWGPANFMKMTHEMFRYAIPRLSKQLSELRETDAVAIDRLLTDLDALFAAFWEHSRHEDHVLFPAVRRFFPRLGEEADEEHNSAHAQFHEMEKMIANYRETITSAATPDNAAADLLLKSLLPVFKAFETDVLPHLRHEEATFTVVVRKYFPIDMQIKVTKQSYELTSAAQWAKILPFTVRNLPHPMWKVRYIQTFLWADPSLAQQIGLQLYRGLDTVDWLLIAKELPECIPRGLPGWKRIY